MWHIDTTLEINSHSKAARRQLSIAWNRKNNKQLTGKRTKNKSLICSEETVNGQESTKPVPWQWKVFGEKICEEDRLSQEWKRKGVMANESGEFIKEIKSDRKVDQSLR